MADKYAKITRATNPLVYGYHGRDLAAVQLAEIGDAELVPSNPRSIPAKQYARKCTGITFVA
jgi:hypothetical protein